ncbi:MAG: hydrolase, partial [Bacteroidetes bacterium QH_1_61_8]
FFAKLLTLPDTMKTDAGRAEGERRAQFMRSYLDRLAEEISAS